MNEPSDATILASARRALADSAPAEPTPAILAAVRREAALRARRLRLRRALLLVVAAAAAAVAAFVLPSSDPRVETPPDSVRTALADAGSQPEPADNPADSAVRLLLLDATEARAALAVASAGESSEDSAGADASADSPDADAGWPSLSFAEALLAWQEAPLADYAGSVY